MSSEAKCPIDHTAGGGTPNRDWWPNQLNLSSCTSTRPSPTRWARTSTTRKEFKRLDFAALKKDLAALMTDSQDWWPADFGHYGPLFIRMAWHSAGTYRIGDGRGGGGRGQQRFAPLNSWPDNVSLDKARRLLWPIKQKYGRKISWADLMILTGNVALETMGFKTFGFGGGREDVWEPDQDVYWGAEKTWLGDKRYSGERDLENPLAAVQMGLIYVNPEGPNGNPDPIAAAKDIRETFARMAMNDEETVALIAGGHTFGKTHGAGPVSQRGARSGGGRPRGSRASAGRAASAPARAATRSPAASRSPGPPTPTKWSNDFFEHLFGYEWELTKSPAGAHQWVAEGRAARTVPDAHDASKTHRADHADHGPLAAVRPGVREDLAALHGASGPVRRRVRAGLVQAHAPRHGAARALPRPGGPGRGADLAGPDPEGGPPADRREGHRRAEEQDPRRRACRSRSWCRPRGRRRPRSAAPTSAAARTARAFVWRRRRTGRSTSPRSWRRCSRRSRASSRRSTARQTGGKRVSLADLIVLGGCAGVEQAAKNAGHAVTVPFTPGRMDASPEQTDVASFAVLEPVADGFRNYQKAQVHRAGRGAAGGQGAAADPDRARDDGARRRPARARRPTPAASKHGVFTKRPGALTNDFFVNLLDMGTEWKPVVEGRRTCSKGATARRATVKWTGTRVDLVFGSNSQLRALAEVYGSSDAQEKFVADFVAAWNKVMNLDRFDRS